jgi:hypothetical protein
MAITKNTFTKTTEFFSSHQPLVLGDDEMLVTLIDDMISYNLVPAENGTTVNQPFGAANYYNFILRIRNLTKNVSFNVELSTNELLFDFSTTIVTLPPEKTKEVKISIDEDKFNALGDASSIMESLIMKLTNMDNGTYAIKNTNLSPIKRVRLSNEIDIE